MKYRKGKKSRNARPINITRDDIEKAMKEFKGEIQYLKVEKGSFPSDQLNFRSRKSSRFNPPEL